VNRFKDRHDAGRQLAEELTNYQNREDVILLALPRGGVPVGYEIARELGIRLDVYLVRKLGVPGHEELAFGAISTGGVKTFNEDVVRSVGLTDREIDPVVEREEAELRRREEAYRGDAPAPEIEDQVAILVDDGLATGASMRAAVESVRQQGPKETVVAVPTAPPDTCQKLSRTADAVYCLMTPEPFGGVGAWYEDFAQTSDEEVRELMAQLGFEGRG
jgi:predicted phosphoribosyltransferase